MKKKTMLNVRALNKKQERYGYASVAPLGYLIHRISNNKTEIIVDPQMAPMIRRLFELMATGKQLDVLSDAR